MCGIAGATATSPEILGAFLERLRHRGPDDAGIWHKEGFGVVHTRLAIIDVTPGGHQPMHSNCGRWIIAYNGEIYNYRQLRRELEQQGLTFKSNSDTEVLLTLLTREGVPALDRLVGMFAFALWDRERGALLLGRDRLGIKPLVYGRLPNGGIAFASEIRALRAHPQLNGGFDSAALSQYLACLYVPAPLTGWSGILKLPPGHVLYWRDGQTTLEPWWRPPAFRHRTLGLTAAMDELEPVLRQAVANHMVADVPVGCFLSGGLDSSVVATLMAQEARRVGAPPPHTFTMTFAESAYDEREAASAIARHIGSKHVELSADAGSVAARLPAMIDTFGEPFGNPTALLIEDLSLQARAHVKVALVGDGGDEVFAGYPRYRGGILARRYRHLPRWLREGVLAGLAGQIPESHRGWHFLRRAREFLVGANLPDAEMYASWVEYFTPQERAELLDLSHEPPSPIAERYREAPSEHPLDAMQWTDLQTFLPGNILAYGDAMSMSHALELRLPLLDHRLIEAVASFPAALRVSHGPKTLLRMVAEKLLPAHLISRRKLGLNPPMALWLNNQLAPLVSEKLTSARLGPLGLNAKPVLRLIDEHRRGMRDNSLKIWSLVVLESWASA